jgi:hypothetical protein
VNPPAVQKEWTLLKTDVKSAAGQKRDSLPLTRGRTMNPRSRFLVGVLTALAMMLLTFALPRGGALRDAMLVQFPMTVGIWAIFVLLFVKLK